VRLRGTQTFLGIASAPEDTAGGGGEEGSG